MNTAPVVERVKRERTPSDKVIAAMRAAWYRCTEPLALRVARRLHEGRYTKDQVEPLISVYIPTYNRSAMLRDRAIPTVLAQDYKNFELVIIGDCCTDDTAEVVRSFRDSRIRFHNIPTRRKRYPDEVELHWLAGPVVAANEALQHVRGEWIARLDDDDLWTTDHLSALLHAAIDGNYEFVSAQCIYQRYGVTEIDVGRGALDPYYTRKPEPSPGVYNPKIGGTQTWLYRSYLKLFRYNIDCWRKAWNKVNDLDICMRMFDAGVRMGFVDRVLAHIVPRPGEETVGVDAYIAQARSKAEHFQFS